MDQKKKIIYIMADNRSGSTLLENILSKSNECFSVGELDMLKGHLNKKEAGARWNWNCSCGSPLSECNFWKPIVEELYKTNSEKFDTHVHWRFKSKSLVLISLFPSLLKNKLKQLINVPKNKNVLET